MRGPPTSLLAFSFDDPAVVIGLGVGALVLFGLVLVGRMRSRIDVTVGAPHPAGGVVAFPPPNLGDQTAPRPDERRRAIRRGGLPTPIQLVDTRAGRRAIDGFVLDRSVGGLRLAMQRPLSIGAVLQVRPLNAPETTPWISVIVRNCRETGDYFEVGCQFETELPWNILLQFG